MSSTNDSTTEHSSESRCEAELNLDCGKGHWSAANIATMVLGFIIFPVLGLIVLVWTILGNPIQELPKWLRKKWNQIRNSRSTTEKWDSDNIVFNEFQQTQFDRIKAIQEKHVGCNSQSVLHKFIISRVQYASLLHPTIRRCCVARGKDLSVAGAFYTAIYHLQYQ